MSEFADLRDDRFFFFSNLLVSTVFWMICSGSCVQPGLMYQGEVHIEENWFCKLCVNLKLSCCFTLICSHTVKGLRGISLASSGLVRWAFLFFFLLSKKKSLVCLEIMNKHGNNEQINEWPSESHKSQNKAKVERKFH